MKRIMQLINRMKVRKSEQDFTVPGEFTQAVGVSDEAKRKLIFGSEIPTVSGLCFGRSKDGNSFTVSTVDSDLKTITYIGNIYLMPGDTVRIMDIKEMLRISIS